MSQPQRPRLSHLEQVEALVRVVAEGGRVVTVAPTRAEAQRYFDAVKAYHERLGALKRPPSA